MGNLQGQFRRWTSVTLGSSGRRQESWREKSPGNDGALGISQQRDFDCTAAILTWSVTEFNVWGWRAQLMVGAAEMGVKLVLEL